METKGPPVTSPPPLPAPLPIVATPPLVAPLPFCWLSSFPAPRPLPLVAPPPTHRTPPFTMPRPFAAPLIFALPVTSPLPSHCDSTRYRLSSHPPRSVVCHIARRFGLSYGWLSVAASARGDKCGGWQRRRGDGCGGDGWHRQWEKGPYLLIPHGNKNSGQWPMQRRATRWPGQTTADTTEGP